MSDHRNRIFEYHGRLQRVGSSAYEAFELAAQSTGWQINRSPKNVERRTEIARGLREFGLSYTEIAEALGYRSHSTIVAALERTETRRSNP